jgi:hypothetical protein
VVETVAPFVEPVPSSSCSDTSDLMDEEVGE